MSYFSLITTQLSYALSILNIVVITRLVTIIPVVNYCFGVTCSGKK